MGETYNQALSFVCESDKSSVYSFRYSLEDLNVCKFDCSMEWMLAICYHRGTQGKLFERSYDLSCSTGIFLRRFLHSDLLNELDKNNPSLLSLDVNEGITSINEQFGDSDYGKEKYSKNSLFWIGYMYRYISYTREVSTKFVMAIFSYKQMNDVYYSFHTQDPEWCVRSLLDINNLNEDVFDNNFRLKKAIKEKGIY